VKAAVAESRRGRSSPVPAPLRLLVVDDSTVARAVLSRMLSQQPDFQVAALAGNASEAIEALRSVDVDIVLLDVEMPGASGIEALPRILRAGRGARVLIVSSMAEEGAETTVRALAEGATDTIPKPGTAAFAGRFAQVLADKIRRIGPARREAVAIKRPPIHLRAEPDSFLRCLALGASTGGLHALVEFLRALPRRIGAPILVTQHLPAVFMPYFARQLEAAAGRPARLAVAGEAIVDDVIHVAPGDAHLCLGREGGRLVARLESGRAPSGCLPSLDPMLAAVAEHFGDTAVGIVLSGMGRDGLSGARRLVEAGGAVLAQDPATASVWGMPRAVAEAGLASAVLPPRELALRVARRVEPASCR
jgi:two-component system chemotaxis response regulator CheB